MRKIVTVVVAGVAVLIPMFIWVNRAPDSKPAPLHEATASDVQLAALGRVEGRGETISVGAATDGVVKEVLVTDGQKVNEGALLAVINCDDISAEIDLAKAEADSSRQARIRLLRGDRDEEREAAARETDAAKAVLSQAQDHLNRMDALYQKSEISRDMFDQAKRDFEVAQANYERAQDEQSLADAKPLPEDVLRADAEVAAAERNVNVATDKLEKCNVRAPISGTILKVLTKAGESYSTLLPHPLFTIADESVRRVRAEVDERDIGKVKIGQASVVTADAFPGRKFDGQVVEISQAMEAKSVESEDPAQKTDRDVLDVVIELKPSNEDLPLGLRVTAEMTGATSPVAQSSPASAPIASMASDALADSSPAVAPSHDAAPVQESAAPPSDDTAKNAAQGATKISDFLLQAGAMSHKDNADALAALLQQKNFPAFVASKNGDPFHRVDVGPYLDLASATLAKNQLTSSGFETILKHPPTGSAR
jgi:ABC exporter DevB family membrane fusion protein